MTFEDKAKIVIKQLREDRDRLQNAFEQIRAEIEQNIGDNPYKNDGIYCSLHIIDKYRESGDKE